jgi:hypothetical protein
VRIRLALLRSATTGNHALVHTPAARGGTPPPLSLSLSLSLSAVCGCTRSALCKRRLLSLLLVTYDNVQEKVHTPAVSPISQITQRRFLGRASDKDHACDHRPHTAPEYPQKVARMPKVGLSTPGPTGKPTLSHATSHAQLHKYMQSIGPQPDSTLRQYNKVSSAFGSSTLRRRSADLACPPVGGPTGKCEGETSFGEGLSVQSRNVLSPFQTLSAARARIASKRRFEDHSVSDRCAAP